MAPGRVRVLLAVLGKGRLNWLCNVMLGKVMKSFNDKS